MSERNLDEVAAHGVVVPEYDRAPGGPRIVHFGVGAFHRAHQALYLDDLAWRGSPWRIRGVGPLARDRTVRDALRSQDWLYTLIEQGPGASSPRVVGALVDYVVAPDEPDAVTARIADPSTSIVSMTISEAGYAETPATSLSTFDLIARGLAARRRASLAGVTVLSCDNVVGNGSAARTATLRAAARIEPELERWVDQECGFPNSMVDRITPATTDADRRRLREHHGVEDAWPVVTEAFRQWVVEDTFAGERPALDAVGVVFTDDVRPWETYKLRILNATHSLLAYPAALLGIEWVNEALAIPVVRQYVETFLAAEVFPTLRPIPGLPPDRYAADVLGRFSGGGVRDRIERLCVDGTVKMATFVIPTVLDNVQAGRSVEAAATALAAWARYLAVVPADMQASDAFAAEARRYARTAASDPMTFLQFRRVFPGEIEADPGFREAFASKLRLLTTDGPLAALEGVRSGHHAPSRQASARPARRS